MGLVIFVIGGGIVVVFAADDDGTIDFQNTVIKQNYGWFARDSMYLLSSFWDIKVEA